MSDARQSEITRRMDALRNQGARTAAQLPRDLDRARDWREHVRAHPIPAVLAAAAVGFAVVPGRKGVRDEAPAAAAGSDSGRSASAAPSRRQSGLLSHPIAAAVAAWAGRWAMATATGALQRFASDQLQSFPSSFTKHGSASSQRRSATTEQRRAYTQ